MNAAEPTHAMIEAAEEVMHRISDYSGPWHHAHAVLTAALACQSDRVTEFAQAIMHGDETHRRWLRAAAEAFIAGQPIPPQNDGRILDHLAGR